MRDRSKTNGQLFVAIAVVAVLLACSKTTSDNVVARGTVTPESGGTIATTDGRLTLAFPPGAVGASTEITVRATPRAEQAPGAIDGFSYTLSPSGIVFDAGVAVTMRILTSDALATMLSQKTDGGADGGLPLALPVLRDDDGGEELLVDASVVVTGDGGAITLTGELRHFSRCAAWIDSITMYIQPPELTMNVGEATTGVFHIGHGRVGTPTGDVLTPALAVSGYDVKSLNPQVLAAAKSASNTILGALLYGVDGDFRFQEAWDHPALICVGAGSAVWQAEVTGTLVQIPATLTAAEEKAYRRKMLGQPFKLAVTADAKCVGSGPPPDGGGDVGPDAGNTSTDGGGVADGGGCQQTLSAAMSSNGGCSHPSTVSVTGQYSVTAGSGAGLFNVDVELTSSHAIRPLEVLLKLRTTVDRKLFLGVVESTQNVATFTAWVKKISDSSIAATYTTSGSRSVNGAAVTWSFRAADLPATGLLESVDHASMEFTDDSCFGGVDVSLPHSACPWP